MKALFDKVSIACSRSTTRTYSTSFSIGIRCLDRPLRDPIHAIYGFVRLADEIVDSFHLYDKAALLGHFRQETYRAIDERISLNPILNSFQNTVIRYKIERPLIDHFLKSMEMDLHRTSHNPDTFKDYITGSAEVVGLMCLRVFCNGNDALYQRLSGPAMSLGSAFQKVNFLRDLRADYTGMGRSYFPGVEPGRFDEASKKQIEQSIEQDFRDGFRGILQLPGGARFGVYIAYMYYLALFRKIKNTPSERVLQSRIRIPNRHKATLLAWSFVKHRLNMI